MVVYELYWVSPTGEYLIIGFLRERRKNPMRITKDSVVNWGKMLLGDDANASNIFFKQLPIDRLADRILWYDLSNHSIMIIS
jgi:hypothetical protein